MIDGTLSSIPRCCWVDPLTSQPLDVQFLLNAMAKKQVVLLGEGHDVAEIHRWQLTVITALHTLRPNLMVGFEMFPRRLQPVLDEWVAGELDTATFIEKSEWYDVWGFPAEIYLPIFHFCRQQNIRMLALNCYRELVSRVGKEGWDAVPEDERDGLTPAAPITPAFRDYLSSVFGAGMEQAGRGSSGRDPERFFRAQQVWDRAFACNIAQALRETDEDAPLVVGVIGCGHMLYGHGTPYQLCDLGITDIGLLITSEYPSTAKCSQNGHPIADAIFGIDMPEPPVTRENWPAQQQAMRKKTA